MTRNQFSKSSAGRKAYDGQDREARYGRGARADERKERRPEGGRSREAWQGRGAWDEGRRAESGRGGEARQGRGAWDEGRRAESGRGREARQGRGAWEDGRRAPERRPGRPEARDTFRADDRADRERSGRGRIGAEREKRIAEDAQAPREKYRDYEYRPAPAPAVSDAEQEAQERILCGRNPIREALRSGREIEKLLVQKGELSGSAREIVQEARAKKIMVQEVDRRRLDEIALHHQGLIAFASPYKYATVEDMLARAEEKGEAPFLVILDGVTDPHNLGAVIRTAECAGAHGVIIPQHRSVGLTPAAVKASAGAIEHLPVARVTNLSRTIAELKRAGVWIYAVTMEGKDFEKVDFRGGTALVIGAEGEGISRLVAENCDLAVSLPMKGALDSLNASVAAGIVMYRVVCSRRSGRS